MLLHHGFITLERIDIEKPPIGELVLFNGTIYKLENVYNKGYLCSLNSERAAYGILKDINSREVWRLLCVIPKIDQTSNTIGRGRQEIPVIDDQWNMAIDKYEPKYPQQKPAHFYVIEKEGKQYAQLYVEGKNAPIKTDSRAELIFTLARELDQFGQFLYPTYESILEKFNEG